MAHVRLEIVNGAIATREFNTSSIEHLLNPGGTICGFNVIFRWSAELC
jgi:hypothetical protein